LQESDDLKIVSDLPEHISYSAFNTFLMCGHMYWLSRVVQAEELPAWWLFGGIALHQASADVDEYIMEQEIG
jgi:hypothetical protein